MSVEEDQPHTYGEDDIEEETVETPPPMPEKKEKKQLTENQLATLAKARQKAVENRRIKADEKKEKKSMNIDEIEPKNEPKIESKIKPKKPRNPTLKIPEIPKQEVLPPKRYFKHNIARGFLMYDETE